MNSAFSRLPIDVILLTANFLEVKDLVHFSTLTRGIRHHVNASQSLWRRQARDALMFGPVAPHSFNIETISASDARILACRPHKLEHLIRQFTQKASEPKASSIDMAPITTETIHSLDMPEASSVELWRALPGNRWVCAILSLEDEHLELRLWDLHAYNEAEGSPPALSVASLEEYEPADWPLKLYPQLDEANQAVNFLLYYLIAGAEEYMLEVCQLFWDDGTPSLTRKASRRSSWADESLLEPLLDGDYVCIHCTNGILLWNWKVDTCGVVPIDDWDAESVRSPLSLKLFVGADPQPSQVPFLLQPPYMLPRMDLNSELSMIALDEMEDSSSDPPILSLTPVELDIEGNEENEESVRPLRFGQRWAVSSSTSSHQLARRDTLLLCERWSSYDRVQPYIWSPSLHTLRPLPTLLKGLNSFDEHTELPSGTLLFDTGSRAAGATGDPNVTLTSFSVYHGMGEGQKSGKVDLAIQHPGRLFQSCANYLCPLSGTVVIGIQEGYDRYYGVFKVAMTRVIALE
ncbi:hypothetical protein DL93DRAFT_2165037 [Clavulina sp. PMI_390]|nr:hypothetical protein DL93DRAFT_2165037 [Clavulina sp. PMI_390]